MNKFRLVLASMLAIGMVATTLPRGLQDVGATIKEKAMDLKGATYDKAKRHVQCAFAPDKYACSRAEVKSGRKWVGIAAAGTVLAIAAGIGLKKRVDDYYRRQNYLNNEIEIEVDVVATDTDNKNLGTTRAVLSRKNYNSIKIDGNTMSELPFLIQDVVKNLKERINKTATPSYKIEVIYVNNDEKKEIKKIYEQQ